MFSPPLSIVADALFSLSIAKARPTKIRASTATTITAFHSSAGLKNVKIAIAATNIRSVSPSVLIASAFILNATPFKTLEKLVTTLAVLLMTFAIGFADFFRTSPVPSNTSPRPSRGVASLLRASTPLYAVAAPKMPITPAIIAPQSIPLIQSNIGWNTSLTALSESGIPF